MTDILSLLSGGWTWIAGIAVAVLAFVLSYFGGKKVGTVQTQAKADVAAAQKEQQQAEQVTARQAEIVKVVKDVEQKNNSASDSAARDSMRSGKYYSKD